MEELREESKEKYYPQQELTIGPDETLSPGKNFLYGLQHVFVSNVWLDPIFVAAMIGLPLSLSANIVNAIFITAGIVTLVQATKLVKLPIVQGPSAAFDSIMISTGKQSGLAAASGGIFLSAMIVFILSITSVIGRLKVLFTPVVSGTVIFLVGISLSGFTLSEFLGGSPGDKGFASPATLILSVPTAIIVLLLSIFGNGVWRSFSFLIALVVGDIIAVVLGQTQFSMLADKDWFGFPHFLPYGGLKFEWGTFLTFFIAYIVAVIEAMGVYQASATILKTEMHAKRVRNGFAGEAAGSFVSSLIGGFPTTGYAQNVGLLRLTGVGSRYPVMVAGVIFLVFGFVPKAGALLALTPDAVVGGIFLPAAATLVYTGISILAKVEHSEKNVMIIGLSILLAISLPAYTTGVKGTVGTFLSNSLFVGAFMSILLQLVFVNIPHWVKKGA
ncbi:NCS2 family nucleobase:cation symporter-2 [Pullulanibacillus pueri]|uniref:Uracil permease n=1 Tax=Pullulanibacillus pueri TaxID=1437324 RepID=A0A8J3ELI9_9BACL|nr:solute carrier family 23 protein [Pullulanibacillus pueri]MBM7681385.1 NCS2 family nucleobase:cation symporter-2 [Pullulanibacillus pueri]GGH78670.1 uracil permease [Pullulanibacillus pueri]